MLFANMENKSIGIIIPAVNKMGKPEVAKNIRKDKYTLKFILMRFT
ncbi:MAG: hypothetical protein JRJ49_05365 [Deltaproteobacteria bacterium]|nr:hypothetical protein [Deltaproteobacteria bacterium]